MRLCLLSKPDGPERVTAWMCCVDNSGGSGEAGTRGPLPAVINLLYCASCTWYAVVCCGRRSGKVSIVVETCGECSKAEGGNGDVDAKVFLRTSRDHCSDCEEYWCGDVPLLS